MNEIISSISPPEKARFPSISQRSLIAITSYTKQTGYRYIKPTGKWDNFYQSNSFSNFFQLTFEHQMITDQSGWHENVHFFQKATSRWYCNVAVLFVLNAQNDWLYRPHLHICRLLSFSVVIVVDVADNWKWNEQEWKWEWCHKNGMWLEQ